MQVNIHEAKTHFSQIIERALAGEDVVIARNGVPILTLKPVEGRENARIPGLSRGKGKIMSDFDSPLDPAIVSEFES
jgi:prevent-host-death family protein